jgi:hypothetical protein
MVALLHMKDAAKHEQKLPRLLDTLFALQGQDPEMVLQAELATG